MKYLLTITITLISCVTFLYYLLTNPNFLPTTVSGEYNWFNIITLIIISTIALFSILNITIFAILKLIEKRKTEEEKEESSKKILIYKTIKTSFYITVGILLVFILNFFALLNWIWGLTILIVVLIATLII